jgi:hypothetical protein
MADWKRPPHILVKAEPTSPEARDWVVKNILIGNVAVEAGATQEAPAPTTYHFPCLARTIMGGPGNRSRIMSCSCGACFKGHYTYVGLERRLCDWYADHAGITGGGEAVAKILRQYDEALDVRDYPDHPRMRGTTARDPEELLRQLRRD